MAYLDVEKRREAHKKIRERNRKFLIAYLIEHPCSDCGETDLRVLEFNHLDPSTKSQNVGKMVSSMHYSIARIEEEIAKCEVLCANCHRKKTLKAPWWSTVL